VDRYRALINKLTSYQRDCLFLVVAAGLVFLLQSVAWPLFQGRDASTYLLYYLEMANLDPVYPMIMVLRTPVAPLFFGVLLQWGGPVLTEMVLGLCFTIAILAVYSIGSLWERKIGLLAAGAVLLQPAYGAIYHSVSSEAPSAFVFVLWVALMVSTIRSPGRNKFLAHGLFAFLFVLTRPTFVAFGLFALFPFLLPRIPLRQRAAFSALFLVVFIPLLGLWSSYNGIRYDDFTLARTSQAQIPFFRTFVLAKTVRPDNGPASAELVQAIESDLLTQEPYLSYGIDLEEFLTSGSTRMWADLLWLSDYRWGWHADYEILLAAGSEAIWRQPIPYLLSLFRSLASVFVFNYTPPAPQVVQEPTNERPVVVDERGLPVPSEGQPIPRGVLWMGAISPDHKIAYDPAVLDRGVVLDPAVRREVEQLDQEVQALLRQLPSRNGSPLAATLWNLLARIYPPTFLWIGLGLIGFFIRPDSLKGMLLLLSGIALGILVLTYMGLSGIREMRIPFDPLYILFGIVGAREILQRWPIRRTFRRGRNQDSTAQTA
jgi:hypothetical protein